MQENETTESVTNRCSQTLEFPVARQRIRSWHGVRQTNASMNADTEGQSTKSGTATPTRKGPQQGYCGQHGKEIQIIGFHYEGIYMGCTSFLFILTRSSFVSN